MLLQPVFQEKNVCDSFSTIPPRKTVLIWITFLHFQIDNIITVLDFSGRIDHILSQINTLHKAVNFLDSINLFLLTKNSLSWLLQPGQHRIHIPDRFVAEQLWCSHVPVGSRCRVTTSGLKWDLGESSSPHELDRVILHSINEFCFFSCIADNSICEFGGMVSSSNTYASTIVQIKCDTFLFWSMCTDNDSNSENDYE